MNISSTTDGETSFTLKLSKPSKRRTISAHKTRQGRFREGVNPSFKTSTISNGFINRENHVKLILSPLENSNKDAKCVMVQRGKKKNKVTFADQLKTVTVLPVIHQSPNEFINIPNGSKTRSSGSMDSKTHQTPCFRNKRANEALLIKERTQCDRCVVY